MSIRRSLPVVLGLGALWGPHAAGQTDPCTRRTLPLTVVDAAGRPITNLTAADFAAKFQGKPVQILGVTKDTHPLRVVILLDASGSMLDTDGKWRIALEVVGDAVAHLPADTRIALVIFDEKIVETLDFGSGRRALAQRIIDLAPGTKAIQSKSRRTALWDSLLRALPVFNAHQPSDVVYLITDGGDNVSERRPHHVELAFLGAGVRLFAFLLIGRDALGYPMEEAGVSTLEGLTETTGGTYTLFSGAGVTGFHLSEEQRKAIAYNVQALYAQMKEFSWLDLGLPQGIDKTREWSLKFNRPSSMPFKDLRLFYPHKLIPCSQAPPNATAPSPPSF